MYRHLLFVIMAINTAAIGRAQHGPEAAWNAPGESPAPAISRMNSYVVNRPKKFDLFSRIVIVRGEKRAMTRRNKFVAIVARSASEVESKIARGLSPSGKNIGQAEKAASTHRTSRSFRQYISTARNIQ
jgi:hypothetical protein